MAWKVYVATWQKWEDISEHTESRSTRLPTLYVTKVSASSTCSCHQLCHLFPSSLTEICIKHLSTSFQQPWILFFEFFSQESRDWLRGSFLWLWGCSTLTPELSSLEVREKAYIKLKDTPFPPNFITCKCCNVLLYHKDWDISITWIVK